MEKRGEDILNAVIDSFIKTGSPVSSSLLYENFDFGIKPAMIRHELENLTELGYLEQPYHSAGRIPSDKAFELFANQILIEETDSSLNSEFRKCLSCSNWSDLIELFSNRLNILSALETEDNHIYKTGLEVLLDSLNWDNRNEIRTIVRDFEELDHRIENLDDKFFETDAIRIFIGKKSPVTESEELAVIAGKCEVDGEDIILLAIGPKRMNYKKVVKTLRGIKENK